MRDVFKEKQAKRVVHWLLVSVLALYILTGFGITAYRTVEFLTFGLLSKALAFKLHDDLIIPFIVLIGLHIYQQTKKTSKE